MLAGGVAVLAGGVAGEPGVVVDWPALLGVVPLALPAGEVPPAGAVCATAQLAQHNTMDRSVNLLGDIRKASGQLRFFRWRFPRRMRSA